MITCIWKWNNRFASTYVGQTEIWTLSTYISSAIRAAFTETVKKYLIKNQQYFHIPDPDSDNIFLKLGAFVR